MSYQNAGMRQFNNGNQRGSSSAIALVMPCNVVAGDLLILIVCRFGDVTVTDSSGSNVWNSAVSANWTQIFYCENAAAGALTITVTPVSSAFIAVTAVEIVGALTSGSLDGTASGSGSTSDVASPSLTVSQPDIVVGAFCNSSSDWTNVATVTNQLVLLNVNNGFGNVTVIGFADTNVAVEFNSSDTFTYYDAAASFKLASAGGSSGNTINSRLVNGL